MERRPAVSVIMPAYNAVRFIEESVDSVLNQTEADLELVVVDDCSNDGTCELLLGLSRTDDRIKFFKNARNLGAAGTRNFGLQQARGRFIAFLDADDVWDLGKLERQLGFMQERGAVFSFTSFQPINDLGTPLGKPIDSRGIREFSYRDMLLKRATLGCSTVVVDTRAVENFTMPQIRTGQDYATWLLILRQGIKAHLLNEVLVKYRVVKGSISRDKRKKACRQWQIYRDIERLPILPAGWFFCNYAVRAVLRDYFHVR